jgi:hypothetical protein
MTKAKKRSPFDVKLTADAELDLTTRLCEAIRQAVAGRGDVIVENGRIDFAYSLYEQQPQHGISRDTPRFGGADLTSPIGTQMVDAMTARTTKTLFVEPFWIVEGAGEDENKAPAVEEFDHWRFEDVRGQSVVASAVRQAFIEEGAIVEVCEDCVPVQRVETIKAAIATAQDGTSLLDPDTGKPMPAMGEDGEPMPAEDPAEAHVEIKRTVTDYIRRGATLRTHSMKDFVFLPGHARSRRDVWGHAWRFWMTLGDLRRAETRGEYTNIDLLGTSNERDQRASDDRMGLSVAVDAGSDAVELELWRSQFYGDLGQGYGCYLVDVSERHSAILSIRADWLNEWRCVYFNPYPRTYSVYGYSLILTKLLTTIEEHTAYRNMNADRTTLKANAPMKRLHGSQWDPRNQPFGAGEVIDVGDMNEIAPFEFEDVSQGSLTKERECIDDATRIVGLTDIVLGLNPRLTRTRGENEMVTEQSLVRIDDSIRNIQEGLEELGAVFHAIEVKAMEEQEAEQAERGSVMGVAAPSSVAQNVELRMRAAGDFRGRFTSQMLTGVFRWKPRGSTESADPVRRINAFTNALEIMGQLGKNNPSLAARFQTPEMGDAMMQWFVDTVKPRDKKPFLSPMPPPQMPGAGPPMSGNVVGTPSGMPQLPPGMGGAPGFGGGDVLQQVLSQMPHGGVQ